jgi:hypothetical protein
MMTNSGQSQPESIARSHRRELTGDELARVGVEKLNNHDLVLRCMLCHAVWAPRVTADGTPPSGYWRCANRCNW